MIEKFSGVSNFVSSLKGDSFLWLEAVEEVSEIRNVWRIWHEGGSPMWRQRWPMGQESDWPLGGQRNPQSTFSKKTEFQSYNCKELNFSNDRNEFRRWPWGPDKKHIAWIQPCETLNRQPSLINLYFWPKKCKME